MAVMIVTREGFWLEETAGRQLRYMAAAAARDGVELCLSSAGRTRAQQALLRERYLAGRGPFAAPPGSSEHEKGLAADFENTPGAITWLRSNSRFYGWIPAGDTFKTHPEWWHYEFTGTPVNASFNPR